jgi:SAM-dependent methyltransferase
MAESFGSDPERYDRARPNYPQAMIDAIVAASPGPSMLSVGCGTGIDARQFQTAGCTVLGVDVDERMVAFARARGLDAEVAAFEQRLSSPPRVYGKRAPQPAPPIRPRAGNSGKRRARLSVVICVEPRDVVTR